MKILLVNDYGTMFGGAELQILTLREGLRQRGHDARFFASCARLGPETILADYRCYGTHSRLQTLLEAANPSAFWQLRRALADFKPDVVHVSMFMWQLSPLILPLLKNVPSLYHVVTYKPICPLGTKMLPDGTACQVPAGTVCYYNRCLTARAWLPLMLQMKLWRRWRSAFHLIVANSETLKRRLMAEGIEAVEVVWGGIPIRPPRPPLSSPPTVAFAGRLVWEKGADVLMQAFAKVVTQIPKARLLLIGAGTEGERLNSLVIRLGLSSAVSLTGHLPRPEMERHFASAWVQVVPSRWAEPFGLAAVDAMMRGTAVVASNSGGLAETVRHGETGFLVPSGDADALAVALVNLLQDRGLAEQMGRAGREVALAHFSEETFVSRFVQLYHTLLRNK